MNKSSLWTSVSTQIGVCTEKNKMQLPPLLGQEIQRHQNGDKVTANPKKQNKTYSSCQIG